MAQNKFTIESFDPRSHGINDFPELAVEPNVLKEKNTGTTLNEEKHITLAPPEIEEPESSNKGFWKLLGKARATLPVIAKILPLLDRGIVSALTQVPSVLSSASPSAPNTKALERSLSELQLVQRELRTNVQNHNLQLKRLEEHLIRVREEVEQSVQEQQEKIDEIRSATSKVKTIVTIGFVLLLVVLGLEGWILYHLYH